MATSKPRRPRSDTAASVVSAFKNAALPELEPPSFVALRPEDRPFWSVILCARAREDWDQHDLVVAAQLARNMQDIEVESKALYAEGSVVENARGTMVANPRFNVLEQLKRCQMALMRALKMGGRVSGDARDLTHAKNVEKGAKRARQQVQAEAADEEEDILA